MKTKTSIAVFAVLSYITASLFHEIVKYYPLENTSKYAVAAVLSVTLGALMFQDINEKPTASIQAQLFAGYIACCLAFGLSYKFFKHVSDSDYMILPAVAVYLIAIIALFAAEKIWLKNMSSSQTKNENVEFNEI